MRSLNFMQKYEQQYQGLTVPLNSTRDPTNAVSTPVPKVFTSWVAFTRVRGQIRDSGYPAHSYGPSGRVAAFSPLLVEESASSDFELVALGRGPLPTTSVSGTS